MTKMELEARARPAHPCANSRRETSLAFTPDPRLIAGLNNIPFGSVSTAWTNGSNPTVYAIDCEMCKTSNGLDCTRVSIVDMDGLAVYDTLVKPKAPIIDYVTRYSGITKEMMEKGPTKQLEEVHADLLAFIMRDTILVGHSIECDLRALKLEHDLLVDTSIAFPHYIPGKRWSLRNLATIHLKRSIQQNQSGHDSSEDAKTCMDLMHYNVERAILLIHQ